MLCVTLYVQIDRYQGGVKDTLPEPLPRDSQD